jgi:threonine dehydratase
MDMEEQTMTPGATDRLNLTTTASAIADLPVSIDDVYAARERIMAHLHRTPLVASATLSKLTGTQFSLKAENFQRTGSFKSRGALNAMLQLTPEQLAGGVVTFSAGNHGQGVAYAAGLLGVQSWVYMASNAVPAKVDAIRGYGGEAVFGETIAEALEKMHAAIEQDGRTYVSPFDDPHVVAGQGVVALEILEDAPDVEAIIVPIGGGGLISGISLVMKSLRPEIKVYGVEPSGAPTVYNSLAAGKPMALESVSTIADGLAAPYAGNVTQKIITACVEEVVLVSDDEIKEALDLIITRTKLFAEPAGAAATAALLTRRIELPENTRVVALLSGGNMSLDRLKTMF